jgi:hypothetical protein
MKWLLRACIAGLLAMPSSHSLAEPPTPPPARSPPAQSPPAQSPPAMADDIAEFFSKIGDQVYEECIFELSSEQVEVQTALMQAYIDAGATSAVARRLAVKQIEPPPVSQKSELLRLQPKPAPMQAEAPPAESPDIAALPDEPLPGAWTPEIERPPQPPQPALQPPPASKKAPSTALPTPEKRPPTQTVPPPSVLLANKQPLPQWDCAPGVDYVTVRINGFPRKLTGGEICNPYQDVVREVPASVPAFRLGYTIRTGRLFVVSDDPQASGRTIAWAISGRDICRNDPDPDCLAARAVGPLPPGEYAFPADPNRRVTWGPRTKRNVAAIYLKKLWNRDQYTPAQKKGILARGNIAIHVRLKGEMSEACIGLEPQGWAYVASLIKQGRATGVNVYVDEPYPQVAEAPPVVVASTFSLTSLFK